MGNCHFAKMEKTLIYQKKKKEAKILDHIGFVVFNFCNLKLYYFTIFKIILLNCFAILQTFMCGIPFIMLGYYGLIMSFDSQCV
jgi:hypothetical protein